MAKQPAALAFRFADLLWLLLVVGVAAGVRTWYLSVCLSQATLEPPLLAQDASRQIIPPASVQLPQPTELDLLVHNLVEHRWFGTVAPLAPSEEATAHIAPGYPWFVTLLTGTNYPQPRALVRWVQAGLGALACGCWFLFARWAFHSSFVAILAGLFCALHPLWVVNVAEINDGTLTSFLLALALALGVRGGQVGGVFGSLLFGLTLAGLCLVRAALLPFAVVGVAWYLSRCGKVQRGWLCAIVAFLGFANALAPWTIRNWQVFGEVLPVSSSSWLHGWQGNSPVHPGASLTEAELEQHLGADRARQLRAEPNQARRYQQLARDAVEYARAHPDAVVYGRLRNLLDFFFGHDLLRGLTSAILPEPGKTASLETLPDWLAERYWLVVYAVFLGTLLLAPLGWRWSYPWRKQALLGTLALVLVPLPYVIGHAENLWGPRLPLDGLLLTLAAFAVVSLIPGAGKPLRQGPTR